MQNPQLVSYFQQLSPSLDHEQQQQLKMLQQLANRYEQALIEGKYDMNNKQRKDQSKQRQKLQTEIEDLKKELRRIEQQLNSPTKNYKKEEEAQKVREASDLIQKLRAQRIEFKKKVKMIDVQNKLKEKALYQMQRKSRQMAQKQKKQKKRREIEKRISEIEKKGHERTQNMESFEKQYVRNIKSMVKSHKRLYERLEEESKEKQKRDRERLEKIIKQQHVKKVNVDWQILKNHQKNYLKVAKNYVLHQEDSLPKIQKQWDLVKRIDRSNSNVNVRRFQYVTPPLTIRKRIMTESSDDIRPEMTRQEIVKEGNRYLQESLKKIDRNKKKPEIQTEPPAPNYIPQVKSDLRQCLNSLAARLTKQIEEDSTKDQTYNKRMLQNILKLDRIIEKKAIMMKNMGSHAQDMSEDETTALYIKNIKNKLLLLTSAQ